MLRKCLAVILILGVLLVIGCAAHVHKGGKWRTGQGNKGRASMVCTFRIGANQ